MNTKQTEALSARIAEAKEKHGIEVDPYSVHISLDERGDATYFYCDTDYVFTGVIPIYGNGYTFIGVVTTIHSDVEAFDCDCGICAKESSDDQW